MRRETQATELGKRPTLDRLTQTDDPLKPFLKWPGGKRWAARYIADVIRIRLRNIYFEPFLGGGAVFFFLRPSVSLLSDVNPDLITTYEIVRDHPSKIMRRLRSLAVSGQEYYRMRANIPVGRLARAVRFLYLNRTCFAGMYRLNRNGIFNVPFGGGERGPDALWQTDCLMKASCALQKADIRSGDFELSVDLANAGDVVYCDPTYTVTHDQNGFIRYNENNFSWADQERLAKAARRATARGAAVIISNAHHKEVRKLYRRATFLTLKRHSSLSTDPLMRRPVKEYLIVS
jgi:DNA adenine methylase